MLKATKISSRLLLIFLMGLASGLPFALTGGTLQAWATDCGVDLGMIGLYSLIGLPYALKFLWAPLCDLFAPNILGRRRMVMVLSQAGLILCLCAIGELDPKSTPTLFAFAALVIAFSSATQDIAIDAYRAEILSETERGLGAGLATMGYRLGMILSGAVALVLADHLSWATVYRVMACVMLGGVLATLAAPEPKVEGANTVRSVKQYLAPFLELLKRDGGLYLIGFVSLYRLGDIMAASMFTPFLLAIEFTKTEIGVMQKTVGPIAAIVGTLAAGKLMTKIELRSALLYFGIVQAVGILAYLPLALLGKSTVLLGFAVIVENLCAGMGTAAFLTLLMGASAGVFTGTQYAVLSSVVALVRVIAGAPSGYLAEGLGWGGFFMLSFVLALPGLVMVRSERLRLR